MTIYIALLVVILSLGLAIFLRFMSLGMNFIKALFSAWRFPIEIWYIHYKIYQKFKADDKKVAFQLFVLPITDLPQVIISYAEMRIDIEAKVEAVFELLSEVRNKEERRRLIKAFEQHGIHIVKKEIKEINEEIREIKKNDSNLKSSAFHRIANSLRITEYEEALQHRFS